MSDPNDQAVSPGDIRPPSVGESTARPKQPIRKIIHFRDLVRCGDEIWIEYEDKLYRLQRTRQGKLVLTK
jgi:hemin uptake protein HemP